MQFVLKWKKNMLYESNNQASECNLSQRRLLLQPVVHVFIYTPYMNQLIKQVNQIYFKYQKLASCLYWLILTANNVSLKVGTWMGEKALPCIAPAFDMGAAVPLNLISTQRPSFRKILEDFIE